MMEDNSFVLHYFSSPLQHSMLISWACAYSFPNIFSYYGDTKHPKTYILVVLLVCAVVIDGTDFICQINIDQDNFIKQGKY